MCPDQPAPRPSNSASAASSASSAASSSAGGTPRAGAWTPGGRRSRSAGGDGGTTREQSAYQRVRPFIEMLESSIDRARNERLERERRDADPGADPGGNDGSPSARGNGRHDRDGQIPAGAGGGEAASSGGGNGPHPRNGRSADDARRSDSDRPASGPASPTDGSNSGSSDPGTVRGSATPLSAAELRARSPYDLPTGSAGASGPRLRPLITGSSIASGRGPEAEDLPADLIGGGMPSNGNADPEGPSRRALPLSGAGFNPTGRPGTPDTDAKPAASGNGGVGASGELRPEPWRGKARKATPRQRDDRP